MFLPKVLPVLDLLNGVAVAAVAGRRSEYQPVNSPLGPGGNPVALAEKLQAAADSDELYVADLNALQGQEPQWELLSKLAQRSQLWLDAGAADARRAQRVLALPAAVGVVAWECLPTLATLSDLAEASEPDRLAFSLDLLAGEPLAGPADARDLSPLAIAEHAVQAGFRRLIVLDLAAVGLARGPATVALCDTIHQRWPKVKLVAGGGVRDLNDLRAFGQVGVSRILVASALHQGLRLNQSV